MKIFKIPRFYYFYSKRSKIGGFCLPPFGIFINKKYLCNQLLLHEAQHYKQYLRYGLLLYCLRYLIQILIFGYHNAPMEQEARRYENKTRKLLYNKNKHWKFTQYNAK